MQSFPVVSGTWDNRRLVVLVMAQVKKAFRSTAFAMSCVTRSPTSAGDTAFPWPCFCHLCIEVLVLFKPFLCVAQSKNGTVIQHNISTYKVIMLADKVMLGHRLDLMILKVISDLVDSVIIYISCTAHIKSTWISSGTRNIQWFQSWQTKYFW